MRHIITEFVYPPIPIRNHDWQARYDDDEPNDEGQMPLGHGTTEFEAVIDLVVNHPCYEGAWCPWPAEMGEEGPVVYLD